jgi:hypothetical protein
MVGQVLEYNDVEIFVVNSSSRILIVAIDK